MLKQAPPTWSVYYSSGVLVPQIVLVCVDSQREFTHFWSTSDLILLVLILSVLIFSVLILPVLILLVLIHLVLIHLVLVHLDLILLVLVHLVLIL